MRPYRRLREGEVLAAGDLQLTIVERLGEGRVRVRVGGARHARAGARGRSGEMPLPPYITEPLADPADYQTVYARAARVGGRAHRRPALHASACGTRSAADHEVAAVTLDVGLDTFRPLAEEVVERPSHPLRALPGARADRRRRSSGR